MAFTLNNKREKVWKNVIKIILLLHNFFRMKTMSLLL